ncbi:LPXTG cell wall anchor domain-containing protein [Streptomyces sp. NPDC005438]|uniref:LPXTG cell wall anchor domain-containing protein n=1 Tax=Streptomyces sp. NPDC005438 TaxID=3156880 RepID=UPI0033B7A3EE
MSQPGSRSVHRRVLATTVAAGGLLCALWFVPSAKATSDDHSAPSQPGSRSSQPAEPQAELANTGSVDTTPYVVGGLGFLALGGGLVAHSLRRTTVPVPQR